MGTANRRFISLYISLLIACLFLCDVFPANGQERRFDEASTIYQDVGQGVFTIFSEYGKGSGFLVDSSGLVVTNAHVLGNSKRIRVQVDETTKVAATIMTMDSEEDIAVIRINPEVCSGLPVLSFPESFNDYARVGERVLAIGSPLSQERVLTIGIVSGVKRDGLILDLTLNPGNSGGPLLNTQGRVIAINTFLESGDEGPGLSGAINAQLALDDIQKAHAMLADSPPPTVAHYPTLPHEQFPLKWLKAAALKENWDDTPYTEPVHRKNHNNSGPTPSLFGQSKPASNSDPFVITALTPPFMYRSLKRPEVEMELRRAVRSETKENAKYDLFDDLKSWTRLSGAWLPVVTITVTPEVYLSKDFWSGNVEASFKSDLADFDLLKDGDVLEEYQRGLVWVPLKLSGVGVHANDIARAGIFQYDPRYFLPRDGVWPNLAIRVKALGAEEKGLILPIQRSTLERIALDFEPYFEQKKADQAKLRVQGMR